MRKIAIVSGLLLAAAFIPATPAMADIGCGCAKIDAAPVCVKDVVTCNTKVGGVCVMPCDYTASKKAKHHKRKKK